jgi:hypothetical protein
MNAVVTPAWTTSLTAGVLRLVCFDLLRFRWVAILVVVLEVARAAFVEWAVHVVPPVIGERFGGAFGTQQIGLLDAVLWLVAILGTALLIQADLPSDDRTFWRTRPIPPVGVALAKLALLAVLFVAVPAAVNTGRLLAYGAPLGSIGAASLQIAVGAGHIVLPAWGLALATRTLPRFCGAAIVAVIGSLMLVSAALYWTEIWSGRAGDGIATVARAFFADWQRLAVRGWWFAGGVTALAAGILCAHYTHRRAGRSATAAVALLVAPWLLPGRALPPAPRALAGFASGLAIQRIELPTPARIQSRPWTPYPVSLRLTLEAPALPHDVSAAVILRHPRLEGSAQVGSADGSSCCFGDGAVGVLRPSLAPPASRQQGHADLSVGVNELWALRQPSLSVDAEAEVRFLSHRWIGTLPVRPGAAFQADGRMIEILAAQPERGTILVRYTRFPRIDDAGVEWTLFAGPPARVPLTAAATAWSSRTPIQSLTGQPRERGTGRDWNGRFHVFVPGRDTLAGDPRLYVVESTPIGAIRHRLTRTGVLTGADHAPAR